MTDSNRTAIASTFTRQLVAEIAKPEGAWRIDTEACAEQIAALHAQYPYANWEGNVHEGYKVYALVRS